jgi:8-oxo-dGTP pyrophosphatase MutT (NUDIX family)
MVTVNLAGYAGAHMDASENHRSISGWSEALFDEIAQLNSAESAPSRPVGGDVAEPYGGADDQAPGQPSAEETGPTTDMETVNLLTVGRPSRRDGVCVGLVRDGKMLLVRTLRYPDVWQPIGGRVEDGETPEDAAWREVLEETGWLLSTGDLRFADSQPMDAHEGTLTFYVAAAPESDPVIAAGEIVEFGWFGSSDLVGLPAMPAARKFYALWRSGL